MSEAPPLGRFYEVEGRRLWLHRSGEGGPTIVFLPGAGTVGLDYLNVQGLAAGLAASILYDRAGSGWSERAPAPRTAAQVTDELRAVLRAAAAPPPYLLVGHSLGGLYARHYAQRFPDEVAALLLLDPAHEDYTAFTESPPDPARKPRAEKTPRPGSSLPGALALRVLAAAVRNRFTAALLKRIPPIPRYRQMYRGLFAREMAGWPAPVREALIERHVSLDWLLVGLQEAQDVEQQYAEVRAAGPMPDVPLIILCSTSIDDFRRAVAPGESDAQVQGQLAGQRRLYETLAASVPRGEVRPVDAGHLTLHYRHPEAVLQAIRDLLGR